MKYTDTQQLLGRTVEVIIDRPLGSKHPKYPESDPYPINYGFIPDTLSPDGDEVDAFVIGPEEPIENFKGKVTAVVHRLDDNEDKLVVIPKGNQITDAEIEEQIKFQEKWFKHELIR